MAPDIGFRLRVELEASQPRLRLFTWNFRWGNAGCDQGSGAFVKGDQIGEDENLDQLSGGSSGGFLLFRALLPLVQLR